MAKLRSMLDIRGTLLGVTIVNSKTYGKHVRVARGARSKVEVNKAFKNASEHLKAAMVPARMIKSAIEQYRADFTGGLFWQRLVSVLCKQHMQNNAFDFTALENMEVREDFPLGRLWKPRIQVGCLQNGMLEVLLTFRERPVFSAAKHVDGYRVQVIALFPDLTLNSASHTAALSPVISLKSKTKDHVFHLTLPANADAFMICIKLEGMIKDTLMLGHSSKGMRIVKVGRLSDLEPGAGRH